MKRVSIVPVLCLLAACGGDDSASNQAGPASNGSAGRAAAAPGALAGIYEGGSAERPDQLCIADKGRNGAQFGLIVWGSNDHSCMGSGQAVRQGNRLTLTMAGDSTCAIEARIEGGTVTLPATVPEGCAYYCGARAQFAERTLTRTGDDVLKAKDLVGDPLCG
jgi:hypothetical protein